MNPRLLAAGLALALAGLPLAGCTEVESESAAGYAPASLEEAGNSEFDLVVFTREGASRTGLKTATVTSSGADAAVPYAALIYDAEGKTYVYTSPKPLSYLRAEVKVAGIEGNRVLLKSGPPAGTTIVTVGAAEVYGTELEVAG